MNSLNRAKKFQQEPGKGLGTSDASIDQEGRRIDKCRGRNNSQSDGDKGRLGADRDRSPKSDVDTSRRDIPSDTRREPSRLVVAEGGYGGSWKPDENYEEGEVMNIITARHGSVEIDTSKIITVHGGMVGFPTALSYVTLPFMEGTEFELFQSIDNPDLAFITLNPFLFKENYEFGVDDQEQEELKADTIEELTIRVLVTIPDNIELMTANLQGPLVINKNKRVAKQIILHDSVYTTKERIFPDKV